jgi:hypothetical protein
MREFRNATLSEATYASNQKFRKTAYLVLSRVRGFVTNNNGVWNGWLHLLAQNRWLPKGLFRFLPELQVSSLPWWLANYLLLLTNYSLVQILLFLVVPVFWSFINSCEPNRNHHLQGFYFTYSWHMSWICLQQLTLHRVCCLVKRRLTIGHSGFQAFFCCWQRNLGNVFTEPLTRGDMRHSI